MRPLCELYLTKSASLVQKCVDALSDGKIETSSELDVQARDIFRPLKLPLQDVVQSAAQKLVLAVNSRDKDGMLSALEDMGVAERCLPPEQQLSRLEFVIRGAIGRAQLILLVELSIFAIELGEYKRAAKYAAEAHGLEPGTSELHDLYAVEGAIALDEHDVARAITYLKKSIRACMTDEYACLSCSVRAPNVMLAEKLLEHGKQEEVVDYLIQCQDVWDHSKKQFASWVDAIQNGERLEFLALGTLEAMNHPAVKLSHLCNSARFPDDVVGPTTPQSPAEVRAGRERLRAEYKRQMSAAIKGELGTSNN